jgi:ABC-type multidrug transport system fused ATPase/permease subunit
VGKATFVNLLARLYDSDEGRIPLDGLDTRGYDTPDLWNSIAVILSGSYAIFRENIGVGLVSHINDNVRIRQAARSGHADTVAERLHRGFEQQRTVRAADRILVLQHGALVEEGSHEALVALDGIYAELFGLQAAGYR